MGRMARNRPGDGRGGGHMLRLRRADGSAARVPRTTNRCPSQRNSSFSVLPFGAVRVTEIFSNGVSVRNGIALFGHQPARTRKTPCSPSNPLAPGSRQR